MRISDWSSDVCSSDLVLFCEVEKQGGASTSSARTELRAMVSLSAVRRLAPRGDRLDAVHDRIDRLARRRRVGALLRELAAVHDLFERGAGARDRKSTRLNSSH